MLEYLKKLLHFWLTKIQSSLETWLFLFTTFRPALGFMPPPLQCVPEAVYGDKATGAWSWSHTSILYPCYECCNFVSYTLQVPILNDAGVLSTVNVRIAAILVSFKKELCSLGFLENTFSLPDYPAQLFTKSSLAVLSKCLSGSLFPFTCYRPLHPTVSSGSTDLTYLLQTPPPTHFESMLYRKPSPVIFLTLNN